MRVPYKVAWLFSIVVICALASTPALAAAVGKITSVRGDVIILNGSSIDTITGPGREVQNGDRIQTEDGEAQVTFTDGAVLEVKPWSSSLIQEYEEESGWLFWKAKKAVRRITNFVGRLWFKSGASKRQNFMQTPTAVCALRGTIFEYATDSTGNNYVKKIDGDALIKGLVNLVLSGEPLPTPGPGEAWKSEIYNAINTARQEFKDATTDDAREAAIQKAVAASIKALLNNAYLGTEAKDQLKTYLVDPTAREPEVTQQVQDAISEHITTTAGTGDTTTTTNPLVPELPLIPPTTTTTESPPPHVPPE